MQAPSLVIVGANKGGVGKTTVARTLIEYFTIRDFDVTAYDTEFPRGGLTRYHPDIAQIIDIRNTRHQCRLLDSLNTPNDVTIVDLKAGELSRTLELLRDVGAFEAASNGSLNLTVLHLLGSSIASVSELEETAKYQDMCKYFIVKNFINNSRFFANKKSYLQDLLKHSDESKEIIVPRLNALAYENVELAGLPFSSFVIDEEDSKNPQRRSFVLRGYVKTWLERVWDNFERAGLDDIVTHHT